MKTSPHWFRGSVTEGEQESAAEQLEEMVQLEIARQRESPEAVEDALGSLSETDYFETAGLVLAALRSEREQTFTPETLQAIGQHLCEAALRVLDENARCF